MKKYIVHTRNLPGHARIGNAPLLVEVEGEIVSALEDPSIMWMPNFEFYFRITKPESLCEVREVIKSDKTKEKIIIYPIYHSHAIYHSVEQARLAAETMVRESFDFELRKYNTPIDVVKMLEICKEIQEIRLSR